MYALASLTVLDPWMKAGGSSMLFFYHVPDSVDAIFEPHLRMHNLASSTKAEAGGSAIRTIAFNRKQITDDMLNDWTHEFQLFQYVGSHFLYPRWSAKPDKSAGVKCMIPSHLNGGTWLKDTGHNVSITAQVVRGLTAHASIGQYRHRFKVGDQLEHCQHCSTPLRQVEDDVPHIHYTC